MLVAENEVTRKAESYEPTCANCGTSAFDHRLKTPIGFGNPQTGCTQYVRATA
jgi:hypothetical protein